VTENVDFGIIVVIGGEGRVEPKVLWYVGTGMPFTRFSKSINLPIVSKPIRRDGIALVEGGVLNNLPAMCSSITTSTS
jgi:hypothetical protein